MKFGLRTLAATFALAAVLLMSAGQARAADTYALDTQHASFNFAVKHLGLSWVHGRFNKIEGTVMLDEADMTKTTFEIKVMVDSVDTNEKARDAHLKKPDFFNEKQFPVITFKSTKVEVKDDMLHVTGDFSMHGVTKSITLEIEKAGQIEMQGSTRTGFTTQTTIKRSDYGMDNALQFVGDEVKIDVSFEAIKQ